MFFPTVWDRLAENVFPPDAKNTCCIQGQMSTSETNKESIIFVKEDFADCNLRQGAGGMKIARLGSRTCFLR